MEYINEYINEFINEYINDQNNRRRMIDDWFEQMDVDMNPVPPQGYNEMYLIQLLRNRRINAINQYSILDENPYYRLYQDHVRIFNKVPQNQSNIQELINNYQANLVQIHFDLGLRFQLLNTLVVQLSPTLSAGVAFVQIDALITRQILLDILHSFETAHQLVDNPPLIDMLAH